MSTTHDLVTALKAELKAAGITYADLAGQLGICLLYTSDAADE